MEINQSAHMDEILSRINHPLLDRIVNLLPAGVPVYLVGGAVRDAFLNRQSYDLDFVTAGDAMKIARKLADDIDAAYFPMDTKRNVARMILKPNEQLEINGINSIRVDFSTFQGADLLSDLQGRDFTMNAMAVEVHHLETLLDPMGGVADLLAKRLHPCSPSSFIDDPIRILRAVRFSVNLDLFIPPETLHLMREAVVSLPEISTERQRDELFRILVNAHQATSIRILDKLNALGLLLPEVSALREVKQSAPHVMDVYEHTLELLNQLESLLDVLAPVYHPNKANNLIMGLVAVQIGRFRQQLAEHFDKTLNPDRPHRGLLFLAGLYHDAGKLTTQSVDELGKIQFIGHEVNGSQLAEKRGQALKLSNLEIDRLATIVKHHMRPALLSHPEVKPSRKAVYRFFRDTGSAGVDICILSLADMLATYGPTLTQDRWTRHLDLVRTLLSAWWENREESIYPPSLVNGDELMEELDLSSGQLIGYLLESIREAQVVGEIKSKGEAINWAKGILHENKNKNKG